MKRLFKEIKSNKMFHILTLTAVALLISSFILPPTGVIDPSVLAACGEIAGFFGLWVLLRALDKGVDASVKHGETEITLSNPDDK